MSRYAIIENGTVVNIVLADEEFAAEQGWVAAPAYVGIGWGYVDEFDEPEPQDEPVPPSVTRRQAKRALLAAGKLGDVEDALSALPSPAKEAALIDWNDAANFERDNTLIAAMAAALNLTSEQVDDLFRTAATL